MKNLPVCEHNLTNAYKYSISLENLYLVRSKIVENPKVAIKRSSKRVGLGETTP